MEYIETNGRQFVDTGVIGKTGTKCEFDFAWLANDTSTLIGVATNSAGHGFVPFAGQFGSGGVLKMFYSFGGSAFYWPQYWSDVETPAANGNQVFLHTGDRHHLTVELASGLQDIKVDGVCYYYDSGNIALPNTGVRTVNAWSHNVEDGIDTGRSMYLFARRSMADVAESFSSVRLYKAKIWQKDGSGNYQLVRDYRPVKLSTGEIALWDKVNKNHLSACWSRSGAETRPYNSGFVLTFK